MFIFGVRSPLALEYEETCLRVGIKLTGGISVNGVPRTLYCDNIIELADFDLSPVQGEFVPCAFAPRRRRELADMAVSRKLTLAAALIDPTAILARSVQVDAGTYINAGVIIGGASMIGQRCLINRSASLGHHTLLGDDVSIGPGVTLAGNIRVGEGSMIGVGAIILPNVRIGSGVMVGAGSLVREHVPDNTFVVGNPAVAKSFDAKKSSLYVEDGE